MARIEALMNRQELLELARNEGVTLPDCKIWERDPYTGFFSMYDDDDSDALTLLVKDAGNFYVLLDDPDNYGSYAVDERFHTLSLALHVFNDNYIKFFG